MSRLYVARKDNDGKLVKGSHPSCLAAWPNLYSNVGTEGYDTRVYIGTFMTKEAARVYIRAFREAYKDGITFKRGDKEINTPRPSLRYYDVDADGLHSSKEFGGDLKDVGQRGYFVINISNKCTEREAYVWLKIFAKPVTYPSSAINISEAFLEAYKALGRWRPAVVALGLSRHTGGYNFPMSGFVDTKLAKDWLGGGPHVTSAYYRSDVKFGSPKADGGPRSHTCSAIVMPNLRPANSSPRTELTTGVTLRSAIKQVKKLLGEE